MELEEEFKNMKKIVISCGPIPAKLDSVKIITNKFKGGLAFKTAEFLQNEFPQDEIIIIKWSGTNIPFKFTGKVIDVEDVFQYYDWFVQNAVNHDVFILAGAVANLTPSFPLKGKFPSHNYKVGEKFNIEFEIAPRSIDIIKKLNPRSTLISYKLFDAATEDELIKIGKELLETSKSNIVFANTPKDAKNIKIALTQDGGVMKLSFNEHLDMLSQIIKSEFFKTVVDDGEIPEEYKNYTDMISIFEKTFDKYGTVAFKTPKGIITTSRGHTGDSVIIHNVDFKKQCVYSSKKATLNAPTLFNMLINSEYDYIIHRHTSDPTIPTIPFEFPGTLQEVNAVGKNSVNIEFHGHLILKKFKDINWNTYYEDFPSRYFSSPKEIEEILNTENLRNIESLEVGGNTNVATKYSLDPFVESKTAINITYADLEHKKFDVIICKNAINYLTKDEIEKLKNALGDNGIFIANTFNHISKNSTRDNEVVHFDGDKINHYLIMKNDDIILHQFYFYDEKFFRNLGFNTKLYNDGRSILLSYKGDKLL